MTTGDSTQTARLRSREIRASFGYGRRAEAVGTVEAAEYERSGRLILTVDSQLTVNRPGSQSTVCEGILL